MPPAGGAGPAGRGTTNGRPGAAPTARGTTNGRPGAAPAAAPAAGRGAPAVPPAARRGASPRPPAPGAPGAPGAPAPVGGTGGRARGTTNRARLGAGRAGAAGPGPGPGPSAGASGMPDSCPPPHPSQLAARQLRRRGAEEVQKKNYCEAACGQRPGRRCGVAGGGGGGGGPRSAASSRAGGGARPSHSIAGSGWALWIASTSATHSGERLTSKASRFSSSCAREVAPMMEEATHH